MDALFLWKLAFTAVTILALFAALYVARAVMLPITLAFLLSFLLSPLVRLLDRFGIPAPLGAGIVLLTLLTAIIYGISFLAEPAIQWGERLPEVLERLRYRLGHISEAVRQVTRGTGENDGGYGVAPSIGISGVDLGGMILGRTWQIIGGAAVMLFLLYFLLAAGDLLLRKLVRVLPGMREKRIAVLIARSIEHEVSRYLFTIALINTALGMVVGGIMFLLGMPNAVLWGVMAGVLNFIPYLGPAVTIMVLTAVALFTFESLGEALLRPLAFFVLTTLEGQLITPLILGRRLMLNPVVIFISLIFWAWMWGIVGALLAVPITMILKILCDSIPPLSPIGELLSR